MNIPVEIACVLLTFSLALQGWILSQVNNLGREMSAMKQKIEDLPCSSCSQQNKET